MQKISRRVVLSCSVLLFLLAFNASAQHDGFLHKDGRTLFPIGFYQLPAEDAALRKMAEFGVNLVRCGSVEALDRAQTVGISGWMSLPLQNGATAQLRDTITNAKGHPALAVWEGPDEVIWNFTRWSGLKTKAGVSKADWINQNPNAVAYSSEQAKIIIPNLLAGIDMIRELDDRPIWFNEASWSDPKYVREYAGSIDMIGCDLYPVNSTNRKIYRIASITDLWRNIGQDKPVWMVLQAFSWHLLQPKNEPSYPTFNETRMMAYSAITHGAKGVLYWGSNYVDDEEFWASLYAMTTELSALNQFLVAPSVDGVSLNRIEERAPDKYLQGVSVTLRNANGQSLLILVNEDDVSHLAVETMGLCALEGKELHEVYGDEVNTVVSGAFITRMRPYQVKIFATDPAPLRTEHPGRIYPVVATTE